MCGSLIIGAFFILFGISIFLNLIFGIYIPVGRVFFGLIMLYIGLTFITGMPTCRNSEWRCCSSFHGSTSSHATWFGSADILLDGKTIAQPGQPHEYSTVFGSTMLDLSHLKSTDFTTTPLLITASTVFGKTIVKISKDTPITITSKSAFASTVLPDQSTTAFGSAIYNSHPQPANPHIIMTTNTVFGETQVIRI
ncbi:MAG: hypothetical protein UV38_C0002G0012 [candidate division TM6 bacterium GW2011_GWE2_42_60]|nr:MAG: hypothetical protein UV38_C0002G0012 [candidate division TM6 bacterium GW2011_GWE2_42_60]HBY06229.1 hypothetical protein [Candidatus Dependentiae bacterium]